MWPLILQFLRSNVAYITLPIAGIVGVIGYNIESLLSDKYTPYSGKREIGLFTEGSLRFFIHLTNSFLQPPFRSSARSAPQTMKTLRKRRMWKSLCTGKMSWEEIFLLRWIAVRNETKMF
uniref:(northern house mosquito) hypothetical protein n=1 Tax=Culex pipiens TaxID=7175 RepID=A0A8D8C850_CULPI